MRVGPFSRLLVSYTLNELGDSAGVVAMAVLVFDRTRQVGPTVAFFVIAKFLPALLAPALTARLDQAPLRRTLPSIYVLEACVFGALALMARAGFHVGFVLALGLIDGALALTGRGLTRGAIAGVLQPVDLLKEGNALLNVGFAVSSVGGAALAGILIGQLGLPAALLLDAASFIVIAAVLVTARGLPAVHVETEPWRRRVRAGLSFARGAPPVRALLLGQALGLVCFTLVAPIEVIYAKESLGTTSAGFGALVACWGAGIVIGSLIYVGIRRRSPLEVILASTALVGIAYLGMATATELVVACALSVVGGVGNGVQWISVVTALQEATPTDLQARVSGLLESIGAAVPGLGYIVGGAIVAVASPRAAFAVAGFGVIALVVAGLLYRPSLTTAEPRRQPSTAST
jgi:Transmembrane secretion effector